MFFMVDFENVKNDGLTGAEHLTREDTVIIFFSENCPNISLDRIYEIVSASCGLEIYKLQSVGKNALDFYIATKAGHIFGEGFDGAVAIVSSDKGFKHIADFWKISDPPRKVIFRPTIEQCILFAERNSERGTAIARKIQSQNAKQQQKQHDDPMTEALRAALAERYTQAILDQVRSITKKKLGLQPTYRAIVKQFGQQLGLEIYRAIKKLLEQPHREGENK